MVSSVILFAVLLPLAAHVSGLPAKEEFKLDLVRERRQAESECTADIDCVPDSISNRSAVPTDLVSCVVGLCVCSECFRPDFKSNLCVDCVDWPYNSSTGRCDANDRRQSQRTTFLLSLFLSSTGAANFYIERYEFAVVQLVIFVLFLGALYVMICPCCVCCGLMDKEGACKGTCLFICIFTLSIIFVVALGLFIAGWWIADLAVFGLNIRLTGDGCTLVPDF